MPEVPGEQSLHLLLDRCATYMPAGDVALVRAAFAMAAEAHAGVVRKSGEPYIEHPIAVARLLADLAIDAYGLAAALLHDTVEDTDVTLEQVTERFGTTVAEIVDGVTKFSAVEAASSEDGHDGTVANPELLAQRARERKARQRAETVRKLFGSLLHDPRVVLLKLADRLHNMRTLDSMSETQRLRISHETLDIYAPLAGRIGLHTYEAELEDLAFSNLEPESYARTLARINGEVMKRTRWAERMCERMTHELDASGIDATVTFRVKHVYRAHVEAYESDIDVAQLHDLIAFRVLVERVEECYAAMGILHQLWHPYGERIRDYIGRPKTNGYQSLHTAVFALDGDLAKLHIRTRQMHRRAEYGVATYWLDRADTGVLPAPEEIPWLEQMPAWLGQISHWLDETKLSAADFIDTLRGEVFEDQVFVFTPKGDTMEMPAGATVLDLAYRIHSEIGDHAEDALVQTTGDDGTLLARVVPIGYVLRSGDIVRVMTSDTVRAEPAWLSIVATRYARERAGRAVRRLHGEKQRSVEPMAENPRALVPVLLHPSGAPATVRLTRCCHPCPGDEIAGLVGERNTISVHRVCCPTLAAALARRQARGADHAERLPVTWPAILPIHYELALAIYGQDHQGLAYEVSNCIAQMGLSVTGMDASANQARYKAAILVTVDIPPGVRREVLMRRLLSVPGVLRVERAPCKGCD